MIGHDRRITHSLGERQTIRRAPHDADMSQPVKTLPNLLSGSLATESHSISGTSLLSVTMEVLDGFHETQHASLSQALTEPSLGDIGGEIRHLRFLLLTQDDYCKDAHNRTGVDVAPD